MISRREAISSLVGLPAILAAHRAPAIVSAGRYAMIGALTARSYIQDGLVAMWDGIENAGWGVHDPNATAWKDLMGGEGFSFASTPQWQDNALVCTHQKSSTAQGITSRSISQTQGEYVFRLDTPTDTGTYKEAALMTDYTTNKCLFGQFYETSTHLYFTCRSRRVYIPSTPSLRGIPTSVSVKYPSNAITVPSDAAGFAACRNGVVQSLATNSATISTSSYLRINGGRSAGYGSFSGLFYCARFYSRALTADEIAANYAVDKARFGLP